MPTWRDELREQLRLALPVVLVQLGMIGMGVADVVMVGHASQDDLAAVALGNSYSFLALIFGMGVVMSLDPVLSQGVGARDHGAVARGLQRGLVLATLLSVPLALPLLFVEPLLRLTGQPPELIPLAGGFTRMIALGLPAWLAFVALRQALQAMHRLRPIVIVIVLANVLNVALNALFIYGWDGGVVSVQARGAVGCALATGLSRWAMALGLLALAWPSLRPLLVPWHRESFQVKPLLALLRLGLPIGTAYLLEISAFTAAAWLMGRIGKDEVAGHQIALNLASITFMVPLGVGVAASVRVGHAVGRGDPPAVRRAARMALILGAGFMALCALLLLALPHVLAGLYTDLEGVVVAAALLIPIAGAFQVFDGIQVVSSGILRGLADTRVPMLVCFVGYWILGIPVSLWLAFARGGGPAGLWWGLVVGLAVVALVLLLRVRRLTRNVPPRADLERGLRYHAAPPNDADGQAVARRDERGATT